MRVVLDTNVIISAIFFPYGIPAKVLHACFEKKMRQQIQVFATPDILKEYVEVIERIGKSKSIEFEHDWYGIFSESCHLVKDVDLPKNISRDAADDKFIACASLSGARYLVSGDKDLLVLNGRFDFSIETPAAFLLKLKKK